MMMMIKYSIGTVRAELLFGIFGACQFSPQPNVAALPNTASNQSHSISNNSLAILEDSSSSSSCKDGVSKSTMAGPRRQPLRRTRLKATNGRLMQARSIFDDEENDSSSSCSRGGSDSASFNDRSVSTSCTQEDASPNVDRGSLTSNHGDDATESEEESGSVLRSLVNKTNRLALSDRKNDDTVSDNENHLVRRSFYPNTIEIDLDHDDDHENRFSSHSKPKPAAATVTGTPASIRRSFARRRETIANSLLREIDIAVFGGRLTNDAPELETPLVKIVWTKKLRTTAGQTICRQSILPNWVGTCKTTTNVPKVVKVSRWCTIELSTKVLDYHEHRLRCTLAHELCHAAEWIIDMSPKPSHGRDFRQWGERITRYFPDIHVTTRHNYTIHSQPKSKPNSFSWKCTKCSHVVTQNDRFAVATDRDLCPICNSATLEAQHAPLTAYQAFVRDKRRNERLSMAEIARQWREHKSTVT